MSHLVCRTLCKYLETEIASDNPHSHTEQTAMIIIVLSAQDREDKLN